jgi:hypothetical protein
VTATLLISYKGECFCAFERCPRPHHPED